MASTALRRLTSDQASKALSSLSPNWKMVLDASPARLERTFRFGDFSGAWGFMSRVALAAEKADHHPNWSNVYNTVEVKLWTHDADGLTEKDFSLARAMDEAASKTGLEE
eukprot:TRINITY_DN57574_c0_g1_i1.p1 TRINITY_DN57574_c0_g1~~TRINITY_DN57574_c0_g1_i1.p1  ORF type:complete len:117 (-),score=26.87 TRINITY_DN57574_c0_g1_i1:15-344(-)